MGHSSIVVVQHDALAHVREDPKFGETLAAACFAWNTVAAQRRQSGLAPHVDVQTPGHSNAASVLHSEHIDAVQVAIVGGGTGHILGSVYNRGNYTRPKDQDAVLMRVMNDLGYKLTRRGNVVDRVASIPTDTKDERIAELEATLKKAHDEINTLSAQLAYGDAKA